MQYDLQHCAEIALLFVDKAALSKKIEPRSSVSLSMRLS